MKYQGQGGGLGYSKKINDPAFKKYVKNSNRWALIFSLILALVTIIGFLIYGETSSEMDNPQALFIGFGIGGMFICIAIYKIVGSKKGKTWDGVVVDKSTELKRRKKNYNNDMFIQEYKVYTVFIRSYNGKMYSIRVEDDDTVYNYYKIKDKVRYHGLLHSYEKFDKTNDDIIFCNACATLNNIKEEECFRCNCPLLK